MVYKFSMNLPKILNYKYKLIAAFLYGQILNSIINPELFSIKFITFYCKVHKIYFETKFSLKIVVLAGFS